MARALPLINKIYRLFTKYIYIKFFLTNLLRLLWTIMTMRSYRKQSIISNMSRSSHLEGNDTYAVINISTNVDHINLEFDQFNFIILEMIRLF